MTDNQMASEIKWHSLDDRDNSTYPKKVGELYLVRISGEDHKHYYNIARLWETSEFNKIHPKTFVSATSKYMFAADYTDLPYKKKSEGHNYIDGWNDLLFTSQSISRSSSSPANSKVWVDLRNKQKQIIKDYEVKIKEVQNNG